MKVSVINSEIEFFSIRDNWNGLLDSCPEASVFLSHDWLFNWWKVFGKGTPYIVACWMQEKLIGLLPLYAECKKSNTIIKRLGFLGNCGVSSDFLDCVAAPGFENEVFEAIWAHLKQDTNQWDLINLFDMDNSSDFAAFLRRRVLGKQKIITRETASCPYLVLPDNWDDLLSRLSKKKRKNLRYYKNKLSAHGHISLDVITTQGEIPGAFEDFLGLRLDRLETKNLAITSVDEKYRQFHRNVMESMLENGKLQLFFLKLEEERIAFLYQFRHGTRIFAYHTGFDRKWMAYSVGTVLFEFTLRRLIEDGVQVFDFLRGDERYKYSWDVEERVLGNVQVFDGSFNGNLVYTMQRMRATLTAAKKLLPRP